MVVKTCENCKFYDCEEYNVEGVGYDKTCGICMCYPPKMIDVVTSRFPIVENNWRCGEYQKKFVTYDK